MPYTICKERNIAEQNAFYKKCGSEGFIPVICKITGSKADIQADVHALEGEYDNVRRAILADQNHVREIGETVFERFGAKAKSWSFGYITEIEGVEANIAQEMSAILAGELDAFVMKFSRELVAEV